MLKPTISTPERFTNVRRDIPVPSSAATASWANAFNESGGFMRSPPAHTA